MCLISEYIEEKSSQETHQLTNNSQNKADFEDQKSENFQANILKKKKFNAPPISVNFKTSKYKQEANTAFRCAQKHAAF